MAKQSTCSPGNNLHQTNTVCRPLTQRTRFRSPGFFNALALVVTLATGPGSAPALADTLQVTAPRSTTITENGVATTHNYPSLQSEAGTAVQSDRPTKDRGIASHNDNYWVREAILSLNYDYDNDGHYSGFRLTLDVDTYFSLSSVYAVLYLSHNGGTWHEYAVTGDFSIYGSDSNDYYIIDAVLDSGYPNGYYDHHIEIYDSSSHALLSHYGPEHSSHFHGLPFESRYYDDDWSIDTTVSLNFSGTGTLEYPTLLVAILLLIRRRQLHLRSKRNSARHPHAR